MKVKSKTVYKNKFIRYLKISQSAKKAFQKSVIMLQTCHKGELLTSVPLPVVGRLPTSNWL